MTLRTFVFCYSWYPELCTIPMRSYCLTVIKDKPRGTLSILLGLGLGAAGAAIGTSALAIHNQNYQSLKAAIDTDKREMEISISKLQESLISLSEVVL